MKFQIDDKVIIRGANNQGFIGGIINTMSKLGSKELFGEVIYTSDCYSSWIKGKIVKIGKFNHYLIKADEHLYCFHNNYEEMEKIEEC